MTSLQPAAAEGSSLRPGGDADGGVSEGFQLQVKPLSTELIELDLPGEVGSHELLDGLRDRRLECVAVYAVERVLRFWKFITHNKYCYKVFLYMNMGYSFM